MLFKNAFEKAQAEYEKTVNGDFIDIFVKNFNAEKKALVVLPEREESVVRATANLAEAKISYVNTLNVYDILNAGKVVLTKAAKESVEEVYA